MFVQAIALGESTLTNNNRGQTVVEYILLLSVIMFIATTIFRGSDYGDFLGSFGGLLKSQYAFSYRHGVKNGTLNEGHILYSPAQSHPSYYNRGDDISRFFTGEERYGSEL